MTTRFISFSRYFAWFVILYGIAQVIIGFLTPAPALPDIEGVEVMAPAGIDRSQINSGIMMIGLGLALGALSEIGRSVVAQLAKTGRKD